MSLISAASLLSHLTPHLETVGSQLLKKLAILTTFVCIFGDRKNTCKHTCCVDIKYDQINYFINNRTTYSSLVSLHPTRHMRPTPPQTACLLMPEKYRQYYCCCYFTLEAKLQKLRTNTNDFLDCKHIQPLITVASANV